VASNLSIYSPTASASTFAPVSNQLAFVQVASAVPQTAQTTVGVTYAKAQGAGNTNVLAVAWFNTTSHVLSVTDTMGNSYQLAAGPTIRTLVGTQAMYYAAGIGPAAAGANRVTVTFDSAVPYPDLRIAEYSGVDVSNPIDVGSESTGSGVTSSSGAATTSNANDLLIGANYVTSATTAAGTGYTSRVVTNPYGNILEDRVVLSTGSYSATATLSSGNWIMQMLALRAAAGGTPDTQAATAPGGLGATAASSTQINLRWAASTDNVGVTNYLIERCSSAGCSAFTQIATSTTTAYNNTGLTASSSYSYRVRATDAANNLSPYSATASATTQTVTAPDTQSPTAPGGLGATATSSTQVNLNWAASTDNVGVTNYLIERCSGAGCSAFTQIATSTTTAYSNAGLTASSSYSYRVRATDAANNLSGYSATAAATTQAVANTAPTISGTPATSATAGTAYTFTPTAADADGDPLTFSVTNKPSWATFSLSNGRLNGTPTTANAGPYANIGISVSDGKVSTALPAFTITVTQTNSGSAALTWTLPTQNTDGTALTNLAGFKIYYGTDPAALNQTATITSATQTSFTVNGLSTGTWYFAISSYDTSNVQSDHSGTASKLVP
jgi:hypothetical protein